MTAEQAGEPAANHAAATTQEPVTGNRARIASFLARSDVRAALEGNGIEPGEVLARIAMLSDNEVDSLARQLDSLPAGGDFGGTIGAGVFSFLILLLTDLLGLTKVFSFTRSAKK